MNEENNGASKNKWSRIFRKKWFFPAVYLTIAALLLSVVVWYQNLDNQIPEVLDREESQEASDEFSPHPADEDAQSVMEQQEVIQMPVLDRDQAEIVTKFYDYNADQEDQENALVLYNNRYYQSTGVDIAAADDEAFEVVAALTGTVTEVKEDPLLGNVVVISHQNEVMTYYASLGEVQVKAGAKVKQGEVLGSAGKNLFGKDSGTHVYFELRKDGNHMNPELYFNQPVSSLDSNAEEAEASENSEVEEDEHSDMLEEDPGEEETPEEDSIGEDEESDE
ncbi:peptidoglycan DD-metalloendopeptidase family protein [Virgibacillus sp. C22-A2]|uniref:Peptidoglycan DD-metalloendopeptidase family protein n=1 Tax=Virgibacillus tibetensis TaxID=3042313 RepID=A0ABU6KHD0_9BACI|nr:peptidoglycan DD-metalloendopeptidase family protein [Virgibacillus sp. C22-A2]